ncbi:MAG: D-aminoacyl-tRNA deacylase [Chloroflexus sp.]|uniref:D-aminoacyl-tRNA deacylase n=1 Tax=Chloroflexus sp. TaxID=1904827 RepID=UPI00404B46B9
MRAVIQRVREASVTVAGEVVGAIGNGLLILLGVCHTDTAEDVELLAEKIAQLRIFSDHEGKFNLSLLDVGGAALVVSQFTLYADTRKGRRPSFTAAARPEIAAPLVDAFAATLRTRNIPVATGVFGAMMQVALINDGPVTLVIDSAELRLPRRAGGRADS